MATILVVDDDALNRSVLTTLLAYGGDHRVEVSIIVVSARDPLANEERALGAGAEAFLQKPVENTDLSAAIERALSKSERLARS